MAKQTRRAFDLLQIARRIRYLTSELGEGASDGKRKRDIFLVCLAVCGRPGNDEKNAKLKIT